MNKNTAFSSLLFCALCTIFLLSCRSVDNTVKYETMEDTERPLSFIGKGDLYGDGQEGIKEGCQVINTQEDWDALMGKLNSINDVTQNFERQGVNFEEEIIVACFDKVRSTGGYVFEVEKATEKTDSVHVEYSVTFPKGPAITILTQPYHIITVRATTKPFSFTKTEK